MIQNVRTYSSLLLLSNLFATIEIGYTPLLHGIYLDRVKELLICQEIVSYLLMH